MYYYSYSLFTINSLLNMMYPFIFAGGSGTRLWPISRKSSPKQIKPFLNEKTLLQKTYERLQKGFGKEQIWIATGENEFEIIKKQLPLFSENQMSLEPDRRDTAAAVGLATLYLHMHDTESILVNINSDADIKDEDEYIRVMKKIETFIEKNPNYITGIGVNPDYPETGYGYIQKGEILKKDEKDSIYKVQKFTEKPNKKMAEKYINSGKYLWNLTLFAWKTKTMLNLFKKFVPEIYEGLMEIKKAIGKDNEYIVLKNIYPKLQKISIDYAIFEKAPFMAVLPASFGWSDIGSFGTIYDLQKKDKNQNVIRGESVNINSSGNLIYGDKGKLIATSGISNMVIIDTKEALLICDRNDTQSVKKIVEKLKKENLNIFL